jgi:homoserine O-acetyltransferase
MSEKIKIFQLGDVRLQEGQTLRGAFLAYNTYGTLSPAKDNVIVYPTVCKHARCATFRHVRCHSI